MDIILIGRIAETGTIKACELHGDRLADRFPASYIRRGIEGCEAVYADDEAVDLLRKDCEWLYLVNGESISDALWKLGAELSSGLKVTLNKLPIRGFCIAVADLLDESPYQWDSTGCVLAVSNKAVSLVDRLNLLGIEATVIGYTTVEKGRCLVNNGVLSYLTKPARQAFTATDTE